VTRHYRGYEKYFENSNRVFGGTGELTWILKILSFI
jgi:hypothetical protein